MKDQEQLLNIGGLDMYIRSLGHAEKSIFFLHGSSLSSALWQPQWKDATLSRHFRLVALDLPGHGFSGHAGDGRKQYSLPELCHTVAEVVRTLRLKNYIIATLSISSSIVGEQPSLFSNCRGFFIAGATLLGSDKGLDNLTLPFPYGHILVSAAPSEQELEKYCSGLVYAASPEKIDFLKKNFKKTDPLFRSHLGEVFFHKQWADEINNINLTGLKTVLLFGKEEKIIDYRFFAGEIQNLWRGEIIRIPEAGHLVNLDQPETFNKLLLEFATECCAD